MIGTATHVLDVYERVVDGGGTMTPLAWGASQFRAKSGA
jgi:hypothetical protein